MSNPADRDGAAPRGQPRKVRPWSVASRPIRIRISIGSLSLLFSVGCAAPRNADRAALPLAQKTPDSSTTAPVALGPDSLDTPMGLGQENVAPDEIDTGSTPKKPWHSYEDKNGSVHFLAALFVDRTHFQQDAESKEALGDLSPFNTAEVRAARIGVYGTIKFNNPWTYTIIGGAKFAFDQGIDVDNEEGFKFYNLELGIPLGSVGVLKLGRQKEPISQERLMSLAYEQFMERPMALDAMLAARNVGVSLSNPAFDERMTWSAGVFNDWLDTDASYKDGSNQLVGRVTGLPYVSADGSQLFHIGLGARYSNLRTSQLRFSGRPEAFFSPDFVDTGVIPADDALWVSLEASWKRGPFWIASEALQAQVDSRQTGDPSFLGYHVSGSWVLTGETRGYDRKHGVFRPLIPDRDVKAHGGGLWEASVRYSTLDLNDAQVNGGEMERVSLGLSWYPTQASRLMVEYGWIHSDHINEGDTQILQIRWQILLE